MDLRFLASLAAFALAPAAYAQQPSPCTTLPIVAANSSHAAVVDTACRLWMWGWNNQGQLASRPRSPGGDPEGLRPVTLPRPVRSVAVADEHTLAITDDGRVFQWGSREDLTCNSDRAPAAYRPFQVALPGPVQGAAGSLYLHLFLLEDGSVYESGCWAHPGRDAAGTTRRVASLPPAKAVGVGSMHRLVLTRTGQVYQWGRSKEETVPRLVPGLPPVRAIAAGSYHSVALDGDGSVWVWGRNDEWQLGVGDPKVPGDQAVPVRVEGLPPIRSIAAGWFTTVAVAQDGRVFLWGDRGPRGLARPAQALGLAQVEAAFAGGNAAVTDGIFARLANGGIVRWELLPPDHHEEVPTGPAAGRVTPVVLSAPGRRPGK